VPPGAPAITTSSLPGGTVDVSYSAQLSASGGITPYSWSVTAGALPAGLSLGASSGTISGTPTTVGTSSFTVRVTGGDGLSSTRSFSITVSDDGDGGPQPLAPSNLIRDVVNIDGRNHFRLRWTDNSSTETHYEVERRTTGSFVLIASLPANSTQFAEPVTVGHPRYRVRACNASGCSAWVTD
jgi:hypothetical protein